jgi:cytochrome c oxidase accessory protein FixG
MADAPSIRAPDRVLATLNADGSRRWIAPRVSKGRFLTARRIVAYTLIAIFAAIPYITINAKPTMLLDIVHRRFTFFGHTFLATDTVLLALLMLISFLGIFLITALFGRVWCGWACPQTVYMEFLYRPIERLIDGAPGSARAGRPPSPGRRLLKYAIYLACSCFLAHVFLAYFVGVDALVQWVQRSPAEHPTSFIIMATTTALMMFNFAFFREQTCLVACPYGRIQSAMLDRHTLIVSYDRTRGEPRGKAKRPPAGDVALRVLPDPGAGADRRGDCVDCTLCVTTCPTGIDIREGLQMECIGCAQCIDACDAVMEKLHRPRGLIRYSSRAILDREAMTIVRPRIVLYPLILAGLTAVFLYVLLTRASAEAAILPRQGAPFYALPSGDIANQVRLRLVNRSDVAVRFHLGVAPEDTARSVRLVAEGAPFTLEPWESATVGCVLEAPPIAFTGRGALDAGIIVTDGREFRVTLPFHMLGPVNRGGTP